MNLEKANKIEELISRESFDDDEYVLVGPPSAEDPTGSSLDEEER